MACGKDVKITVSVLVTVIVFVGGILVNNSVKANADIQSVKDDTQRQLDQIREDTRQDLQDIKSDVRELNKKFDAFILSQKP